MDEEIVEKLKWIFAIITGIAITSVIYLLIVKNDSHDTSSTTVSTVCGNSAYGWQEKYDYNYDVAGFNYRYGDKVVYSISQKTAACLGIVGEKDLDTGENYLYINPRNFHFDIITASEIQKLQEDGELCLTTEQAWNNINKKRTCVGFYPTKLVRNSGFIFLNEKHDYVNGFTATIMHDRLISWDDVLAKYNDKAIVVSGTIEEYQNHPEIKIYDLDQVKAPATLYAYSTKYGFVYKSANSKLQ